MRIPMLKIRRSCDRLIFNMGIPILVRRHLYTETVHKTDVWQECSVSKNDVKLQVPGWNDMLPSYVCWQSYLLRRCLRICWVFGNQSLLYPWVQCTPQRPMTPSGVTWEARHSVQAHDGVIKWKHFPRYWRFVRGIHRSRWPVDSLHKGQWRGALMFYLFCAWTNGWANNRDAGDLRRHRTHSNVTVMCAGNYCIA